MNVESRKKKTKQRLRENKADYTICFTRRNTLFHEEKHFVSVRETHCFTKGNTLHNLLCDFSTFARENFVGMRKFYIFAIGERNKAFEFLTFEKEEQKETKNNL